MTAADPYREYLGGITTTALVTTFTVNFNPRAFLVFDFVLAGFDIADNCYVQFNSDTGSNYVQRYLNYAAGTATPANNVNVSQAHANLALTTSAISRIFRFAAINVATSSKGFSLTAHTGAAAQANAAVFYGGFEWVNTTSLINSITVASVTGTSNFNIGTTLRIHGSDFL